MKKLKNYWSILYIFSILDSIWQLKSLKRASEAVWGWSTRQRGVWSDLTTWQGPRQRHKEVAEVIGMTNEAPPAWHQQPFPCCCGDGLQSCKELCRMQIRQRKHKNSHLSFFLSCPDKRRTCMSGVTLLQMKSNDVTKWIPSINFHSFCQTIKKKEKIKEWKWRTTWNTGVSRVSPELVLLRVGFSENVIPSTWRQTETRV